MCVLFGWTSLLKKNKSALNRFGSVAQAKLSSFKGQFCNSLWPVLTGTPCINKRTPPFPIGIFGANCFIGIDLGAVDKLIKCFEIVSLQLFCVNCSY